MNRRTFNRIAGLAGLSAMAGRHSSADELRTEGSPHQYMLGTSYYPEWWSPSEWVTDFSQMASLGLNTVRMGEFAWSTFEPAQGKYSFELMDHAIEIANHYGLRVVMGTPTAAVPPWLYALHPDVLGASAVQPYSYGGRKGYCVNSANYLAACADIVRALGAHYGNHRGVIGWQLDNEPGIPFECFDSNCEHAFRRWLKQRYGTIEVLNRTWNGAFWSNKYDDWSEIYFPKNPAEGSWPPEATLNYREFFSDSYLEHLRRQATILKSSTRDQFISTNWPSVTWSVDVYKAGEEFLDMTAWDNYCSAPGLTEFQHQYISCMNHDMARSASRGQRFFCGEQIAYLPPNALPQALRLQAYLNLAHGAHGHLYFEWRRPLAGGEQARPSFVKGFDGNLNPAKPIFEQIGREFARLGPRFADAKTHADVALLYDFTNEFAQGFWSVGQPAERYDGEASRVYAGLKSLQRNIDITPLSADLSRYKILAAPNLRLIDDSSAKKLESFVADGGVLLLSPRSGTQNGDASMRRAVSPGIFTVMAGVSVDAKLDLQEYSSAHGQMDAAHEAELGIQFQGSEGIFKPRTIMESLVLHGADPVATFRGGRLGGLPAIVRHRYKSGWVIYAGTDSGDHGFQENLVALAASIANIKPLLEVPRGVAVTTREDERHTYYFILNLTETRYPNLTLPHAMFDVLNEDRSVTSLNIEPLGVALLYIPK